MMMRKALLISFILCNTLLTFSQRSGHRPADQSRWLQGTFLFNNRTANNLDIDSNLLSSGFTGLSVVAKSDNPDNFKFDRDKYDIVIMNDFQVKFSVLQSFVGRTSNFTIYIYSNRMMVYKKRYSVMFDGSAYPKVIMLGS